MAWFFLTLGGLFEIGFTTSLRFVDGFRNLPWTLAIDPPRRQTELGALWSWSGIRPDYRRFT